MTDKPVPAGTTPAAHGLYDAKVYSANPDYHSYWCICGEGFGTDQTRAVAHLQKVDVSAGTIPATADLNDPLAVVLRRVACQLEVDGEQKRGALLREVADGITAHIAAARAAGRGEGRDNERQRIRQLALQASVEYDRDHPVGAGIAKALCDLADLLAADRD